MPDHPTRGPNRRGIAAAVLVPAAAVAAIFTASNVASGNTSTQEASPLPTVFSPPGGNTGGGPGTTGSPGTTTGTGTATRTPTPTRTATPTGTGTGVVPPGAPTGTAQSCVSGTATPTRTGTGVAPGAPSSTGTRTSTHTGTPTRTGSTATATPAPGGTGTSVVPGAAEQTGTGTPTATQPGEHQTTLRLGEAGGKSDVLVDENGCALYLNTSDTPERTDVNADQETTWIPVPAPATVTGPGLDQAKVGEFTRPDGKHQATYNGHQLYRFSGDRAPGEAKGQGVDGKYFLVNKDGEPAR